MNKLPIHLQKQKNHLEEALRVQKEIEKDINLMMEKIKQLSRKVENFEKRV